MFEVKEENIEVYPMGIILFKNVLPMKDHKYIIDFARSLRLKALKDDFVIIKDELGEPIYAINRSGHRYSLEDIDISCNHIMNFMNESLDQKYFDFFQSCEDALYSCMLRYVEFFPMMLPCLWWRTQGHIVGYGKGGRFGKHCDNDVNYQPGAEPDQQLAIRNVLGGLIYFNNSVSSLSEATSNNDYVGGEIYFPYADFTYSPKAGDVLMFPSNYLGTHKVLECKEGERYAYVGYFAQGSNDLARGVNVREPSNVMDSGQVWMPDIMDDYMEHINKRHPNSTEEKIGLLTEAVKRQLTSAETSKEINKSDF
jgi:predicted 2-oxoglutarate/Fe(II)-dependent dioxygenase YbiX